MMLLAKRWVHRAVCAGLIAVSVAGLEAGPVAARMLRVADAEDLSAALARADGGDRIVLGPGHYGALILKGRKFSPPLTITADGAGGRPVFASVNIDRVTGLRLSGLDVIQGEIISAPGCFAGIVSRSGDIAFDDLAVMGAPDGVAGNDGIGLIVRETTGFVLENSLFTDLLRGVSLRNVRDVTLADNFFAQMGSDAIAGGGIIGARIDRNQITNFQIVDRDRFHPDGIQIWAVAGGLHNEAIDITGNRVLQGAGDPVQGIFIDAKDDRLSRVSVRDNIIQQDNHTGILIGGARAALVAHNTVIPFRRDGLTPSIRAVRPGDDVRVEHNLAAVYLLEDQAIDRSNITLDLARPWSPDHIARHVAAPFNGRETIAADLAALHDAGAAIVGSDDHDTDRHAHLFARMADYRAYYAQRARAVPGADARAPACLDTARQVALSDHRPLPGAPTGGDRVAAGDQTRLDRLIIHHAFAADGDRRNRDVAVMADGSASIAENLTITLDLGREIDPDASGVILTVPRSYQIRTRRGRLEAIVDRPAGPAAKAVMLLPRVMAGPLVMRWNGADGRLSIALDGVDLAEAHGAPGPLVYRKKAALHLGGAPWSGPYPGALSAVTISRE